MSLLLIFCFPFLILCAEIEWKKMVEVGSEGGPQTLTLTSSNGDSHYFWLSGDYSDASIQYTKASADGTLTSPKAATGSTRVQLVYNSMAGDISADGQHLLLVFCGGESTDVYLVESFDGGREWKEPVRVMKERNGRKTPKVLLEKETGRIYVMYNMNYGIGLTVREPGAESFTDETLVLNNQSRGDIYLTQVKDKETSKPVFHLFADLSGYTGTAVDHLVSFDNGKNWTYSKAITAVISSSLKIPVAVGAEGHFYVQYHTYKSPRRAEVVWTKNYGETWERPIAMRSAVPNCYAITMCGKGNYERVISVNGGVPESSGYVKYLKPGETKFEDLKYPLPFALKIRDVDVSCGCDEYGKYTLAAMLVDGNTRKVYIAYGSATNL